MNQLLQRALLLIVLGGGYLLSRAWAQAPETAQTSKSKPTPEANADDGGIPPAATPAPLASHGRPPSSVWGGRGRRGVGMMRGRGPFAHPMSEEEMQEFEALHQAVEKLKTAKSDAEKTSATNEISQVLEKWFKRDLQRRETQISEIETRVKKLRDQIDKRKKAKDEIINLRLRTIINEADGLGFPGAFEQGSEGDPFSGPRHRTAVPPQAFDFGDHPSQEFFDFGPKAPPSPTAPRQPFDESP
ncbi:MAG TPA: hypothetical protein VG055_33220 [Planctomycetaceae bacterium]|nr:hypothetical protein [Planctomycetaceae bacterium]